MRFNDWVILKPWSFRTTSWRIWPKHLYLFCTISTLHYFKVLCNEFCYFINTNYIYSVSEDLLHQIYKYMWQLIQSCFVLINVLLLCLSDALRDGLIYYPTIFTGGISIGDETGSLRRRLLSLYNFS